MIVSLDQVSNETLKREQKAGLAQVCTKCVMLRRLRCRKIYLTSQLKFYCKDKPGNKPGSFNKTRTKDARWGPFGRALRSLLPSAPIQ
mmetsp:Transcript_7190/g.44611  ORF Transcript_7190/g.44611 Transcript_7190/m.44611 type:complete len:88 (+) Transcript_7190:213-476(+)